MSERHPVANLKNAVALAAVTAAIGGAAENALSDQGASYPEHPMSRTTLVTPGQRGFSSLDRQLVRFPAQLPAGHAGESTVATKPEAGQATKDVGSENVRLPEEVQHVIQRDTVYIPALGCSGGAIRDSKDRVIGILTAEHCSLTEQKNERIKGNNGKHYIVESEPVKVQTGADMSNLSTIATIDSFIVPRTGDLTHDIAIGVAKGHDPAEVLRAYEASQLSQVQLHQLKMGDTMYMAGWPQYQPKNKTGSEERQAFAMTILGTGQTTTTEGKTLKLVWAAVPPTKDGAECSYGASGSEGFVMIDGQPRAIGTLSAFYDLTGKVPDSPTELGAAEPPLGIGNSKNIAAICGFSYELPTSSKDATVLNVVHSANGIPGYISPEAAVTKARQEFKDIGHTKTIIDGTVEAPLMLPGSSQSEPIWVNNPVLFIDAVPNYTVLAWANANNSDHLNFTYVEDKNLDEIVIYPHDGQTTPDLLTSIGPIQYQADPTGQTSGDFVDSSQQVFGSALSGVPNVSGGAFSLGEVGKTLTFVPAKSMK